MSTPNESEGPFKYLLLQVGTLMDRGINSQVFSSHGQFNDERIQQVKEALEEFGTEDVIVVDRAYARQLVVLLLQFLKYSGTPSTKRFITDADLTALKKAICSVMGVEDYRYMKRKTRKKEIVVSRQLFFSMMKKDGYGSLAEIGALMGKDHSTVVHANKAITNYIQTRDVVYYKKIVQIVEAYNMELEFGIYKEELDE